MTSLSIHLFGLPDVELDGECVTIVRRKAVAILAYLAVEPGVHHRDTLAALLWPEYDQSTARGNLRRMLSILNRSLGDGWLDISRDTVELPRASGLTVDVVLFEKLLDSCRVHDHPEDQTCQRCRERLAQAVDLYRDDFLVGFTMADSPEFEEWQLLQTEYLRRGYGDALRRLAHCCVHENDLEAALRYGLRRLALDSLDEDAHRALMRLYAWRGDRSAALRQYAECVHLLADELGVKPQAETTQLRDTIAADTFPPPVRAAAEPAANANRTLIVSSTPEEPPAAQTVVSAGELRLVTVLCAGPVFSQDEDADLERMALDTSGLLAELKEILEQYDAHVTQHLGSGVLAVFGVDRMHEDDAERAVHAALQIRDAADSRGASVGTGVHTGRVYVPPASLQGGQPAVLGAVVNIAARLRDLARSGEVLLSQVTYDQTRLAFHASLRPSSAGARGDLARIYAVERVRQRPRRTHGIEGRRARLIGRDSELAVLNRVLHELQSGTGNVVLLTGEAGIGKSRLVEELDDLAATLQPPILWLEGRGLEMTAASAYAPFVSLLRGYFSSLDSRPQPSLATPLRVTLQSLVDDRRLSTDQQNEMGPLLGRLLSIRFEDAWDNALAAADPQQIQYRTYIAVKELLAALAQKQPLVVVLEDLHWADDLSLDLAAELMSVANEVALLLVCVYRSSPEHRSHQLAAQAARRCPGCLYEIRLAGLPPGLARTLVSSLLDDAQIEPALLDQILTQAQGNPFFVEEIVRSLLESSAAHPPGSIAPRYSELRLEAIPATVQSVILSRFDRLPASQRRLLRRAAVIGRTFRLPLLAQMAADDRLSEGLTSLEDRGFLYLERSLPVPEYSFWHVLTQQAVYSTLTRQERMGLHQQVGEAIEGLHAAALNEHLVDLAYHYDRSDQVEKAIVYLLKAGEKLRRDYANEGAISHVQRALARADELARAGIISTETADHWRYVAHEGLGRIYTTRAELADGETHLREAVRLAKTLDLPPTAIVRMVGALAEVLFWSKNYADASDLVSEALSLLGGEPSIELAVMNHHMWIFRGYLPTDPRAGIEYLSQNAQFLEDLPYVEELRSPYFSVMTYCLITKQLDRASHWFQVFQSRARAEGDLRGEGEALLHWAIVQGSQGDYDAALVTLQRTADNSTRIGDVLRTVWALSIAAYFQLIVGRFELAHQALDRRRELFGSAGLQLAHDSDCVSSTMALVAGDVEGAVAEMEETIPRAGFVESPVLVVVLLHRAELFLRQERLAEALAAIEEAIRVAFESRLVLTVWGLVGRAAALPRIPLAEALSKYEAASTDTTRFRARCQEWRSQHPDFMPEFTHWHLAPEQASSGSDEAATWMPSDNMIWSDPLHDCRYVVRAPDEASIILYAANGRDLWHLNRSAPRLLQPVSGDFALEAIVSMAHDDRPAMGGLLLWKDEENYLRLSWGQRRPDEISFEGNIDNRDLIFGRGKLPGERICLRLERTGSQVRALCSADGKQWFTAGATEFSVGDPLGAGVYATGFIDRAVHIGVYAGGTAIRFEQVRLAPSAAT